jgi:hypothetical protein
MALYSTNNRLAGSQQNLSSSYKTIIAMTAATGAATLKRGWIYEAEVGADGAPNATDCAIVWDWSRQTAAGTSTAATPNPLDAADAAAGLGRESMTQSQCTHLLGQIVSMAAHLRTKGATTTTELRHASRTVTCTTCALLLVHFLARAPNVSTVLDRMCTSAALSQLIADHASNQIFTRLEAENGIIQFNRTC